MDDKTIAIEGIPCDANKEDPRLKKLHPLVIPPPFCFLLVGSPGTGKSSLLYTMCSKWYSKYFDLIVIYNGVKDSDEAFMKLQTTTTQVIVKNEWNPTQFESFLNTLEQENNNLNKSNELPRNVLVIFDDMITQQINRPANITILDRAIQNRRHYNLSLAISTQSYKQANRSLRALNLSALFITGANSDEIKMISEEHTSPYHTSQDVIELYKKAMQKRYSFFLINYKKPPTERYYRNLDECLS